MSLSDNEIEQRVIDRINATASEEIWQDIGSSCVRNIRVAVSCKSHKLSDADIEALINRTVDGWVFDILRSRSFTAYSHLMMAQGHTPLPKGIFLRGVPDESTPYTRFTYLTKNGIGLRSCVSNSYPEFPEKERVITGITPQVFMIYEDEPLKQFNNAQGLIKVR